MPRLLIDKGPDRGKSITITAGRQIVVGRDDTAQFVITDSLSSRRHFLIGGKNGVFGLKDLKSANGTRVNGKKVENAVKLQIGDSIQVGETLMSWMADKDGEAEGLVGQQIGGYRIESRLGRGAMGTVYKAVQLSLSRTVALKVLSPDLTKDQRFTDMFLAEARSAGGLNHPNIIQVYDVGDDGGQYYFSMEFAERGSVLDELQQDGKIKMARAITIIRDAANALDYAERKSLVHRDVKPDNLMVAEDFAIKLGDLGLAMSSTEIQEESEGVFGTPHYIAPEQAMGKPIDHRADIYALGATFYRIITGRTLYKGSTVKEILRKQVKEPHEPVQNHLADCPDGISKIIDRMLAKSPAERYQHASDIVSDLDDFIAVKSNRPGVSSSHGFIGAQQTPTNPPAKKSGARNKIMIGCGVFLILLLASVGWIVYAWVLPLWNAGSNLVGNSNQPWQIAQNNNTGANNTPTRDNSPISAAERTANNVLTKAIILAEEDANNGDLPKARMRLENALNKAARASKDIRKRAKDKLDDYIEAIKTAGAEATKIEEEYNEMWRKAQAAMEEFHFVEAKKEVQSFIDAHKDSPSEIAKEWHAKASDYLKDKFDQDVADRVSVFEGEIETHRASASRLTKISDQILGYENLIEEVDDAIKACDTKEYDDRLKALKKVIEGDLSKAKKNQKDQHERTVKFALNKATTSFYNICKSVSRDIARGDFESANNRVTQWKSNDRTFKTFKNEAAFKPLLDAIAVRSDQTQFVYDALKKISANGGKGLTGSVEQLDLLSDHPWPKEVADLLGDPQASITFYVEREMSDTTFELRVFTPSGQSKIKGYELSDAKTARTVVRALVHLLTHDKQMASRCGAKALAGLWAWCSEAEQAGEAWPLINQAFSMVKKSDSNYAVIREYYAWGLLTRASWLQADGQNHQAKTMLRKLETEFKDTRAAGVQN